MKRYGEEVIVGLVMILLIVTNLDARGVQRGTPAYIDRIDGALDTLNALLLFCGVTLLYKAGLRRDVTRWAFALLTVPLLLYIAATLVYTFSSDLSKSAAVIYLGFYAYLMWRVWTREQDDV